MTLCPIRNKRCAVWAHAANMTVKRCVEFIRPRYLWWSRRRSLAEDAWHNPRQATICSAFLSPLFFFISFISFKRFFNFPHNSPPKNIILSALEVRHADHACGMTHGQWKSTDPLQLPCLFSPRPQLSLTFHAWADAGGDVTRRRRRLTPRCIYWLHKNTGYLTRVITVCGPRTEERASGLYYRLGRQWYQPPEQNQLLAEGASTNRMAWAAPTVVRVVLGGAGLGRFVTDVAGASDTRHVNERRGDARAPRVNNIRKVLQ